MKTKASIKNLNKEIQKRNDKFLKMSKSQKRIALAQDVLVQLKRGKIKAGEDYCEIKFKPLSAEEFGIKEYGSKKVELQTLLDTKVNSCEVCAIGSLFISKVALGNHCKVDFADYYGVGKADVDTNLNDDELLIAKLKGIFTNTELRYIEYAYEGWDVNDTFEKRSEEFHDKLVNFYKGYKNDKSRLKAIMENIIKNKGNFII